MTAIDLSIYQMMFALVFIFAAALSSFLLNLGLHRDILWGSIRMISQLVLMGYVLTYVFQLNSPWLVLLVFGVMIFFAANIIKGRVKGGKIAYYYPTLISMFLSYIIVTYFITAIVINVEPWYQPQYFIPLGGMVVGNSMNAISISLERLFSQLRDKRDLVEMYLTVGADYKEASADITREAISAGMIPAINSLMGMGLVFLPGMMTGQILAGADPLFAIKYQIVIMMMVVGATAMGSILVTLLVRRRCFSPDNRLLVR
ncbi:iron export ABC transporter permease subunit FetB [Metallumcola ferriviriculae]|uniref:Iron export ABC transporter permease subunit FetB n=1 Tax=Metallumcola ferriviriculae TaxID=3039180 RepID=A0AAU0UK62_9FIRM|nr:iron export ABC transporter permease subunit FetB [Desulfitibacteraceae bacterium MK1]